MELKQVVTILKNKAGFISIETVIVAGLMIALGAYAITQLYMAGQSTTETAIDNVNKVLDVAVS
ncbi:hypothetical protein ACFVS2_21530 [Brevibacillus sp. NPDC058079]|uniref:hypothetical protein n=1 Tax=Brevibacillus sp. NPDC058079 TaxID=3346330 RepID=UPI0036E1A51B